MLVCLDMRRAHEINAAWVGDNQAGALTQAPLHLRREHGMSVGGIGADDEDHVGFHHGIEILSAGGFAQRLFQSISGGRMAHPRTGVDIVVTKAGAHQFLDQVGLFVRTARGGDAADRIAPVFLLKPLELSGGVGDRLLPGDLAPRIGDFRADHGLHDTVRVGGIADGETTLDTRMPVIGVAVFVGDHAHEFLALHLGPKGTAHAAVRAGRHKTVLGLTLLDQRILRQRRCRAGLDASSAGDALGVHERHILTGRHGGFESASLDGQRQRPLLFITGAHAA